MSDQEINIAIAEACGWKEGVERYVQNLPLMKAPPDCVHDLNDMHEAEKVLTCDQQVEYSIKIGKLKARNLPGSKAAWMDFSLIHATARQRAEAFLRTIGKWKEGAR